MRLHTVICLCLAVVFLGTCEAVSTIAQTSGENKVASSLPTPGGKLSAADRTDLQRDLANLDSKIKQLAAKNDPKTNSLLPDVQIFSHAVAAALHLNEFYSAAAAVKAKELLKEGNSRADRLLMGESPWTTASGFVLRGHVSRIDGSVQPYGLVVPDSYRPTGTYKFRLDVDLHDGDETLNELNFLDQCRKTPADLAIADTIVLRPYGRGCNAFKFAGEMDVLEAIDAVKRQYRIDDDRIFLRGFGAGGAGCWQLAVHYPDRWILAVPAASFVGMPQLGNLSDDDFSALPEWQRKLLHLYDCPDWAANLYHCATIAYANADEAQTRTADLMEAALQTEGIALRRIAGTGANHSYDPQSKQTIESAIASIAESGGRDRNPNTLHFVTYTLHYNRLGWIQIDGLAEHCQESRVDAQIAASGELTIETKNVTDLTLSFLPGWAPFDPASDVVLTVDNDDLTPPRVLSDRSWTCQLHRDDQGEWKIGPREEKGLRKRPGLQGPIDDAFIDSFIMVRPTGKPSHDATGKWVQSEMERAIHQWNSQFNGQARVKDDTAVTDNDIASANLILWGDAESNAVIKRIADKLPIRWDAEHVSAGEQTVLRGRSRAAIDLSQPPESQAIRGA